MSQTHSPCDHSIISRFIRDELDQDEHTLFVQHLSDCQHCQRSVEDEAAVHEWWDNASGFLNDDDLDSEMSATLDGSLLQTDENPIPKGAISGVVDHLNPSDDPRMMGRFGGYEIVGVIGCGGMGVVLKGHESALNRYVAIKVLAPHLAMSGAARARFSREGQSAASVVHQNVVAIHRVAEADGLPFLVMPYVGGESLQRRISDHGPLPVAAIVRVGLQVCRGLAAAHSQGLVHRDIKPANILLEQDVERVILTDFGLARAADDASMTNTGVLAGTPQYMSPEQARGERVDQRSDLFSLGSVLYTLCTGRPPFRSETSYGVLRKITDSTPRPIREINPDIPDWLVQLIETLQEKDPEERLQSAEEIADLLEQCLAHLQQPESQPLPEVLNRRKVKVTRRWKFVAIASICVACLSLPTLLSSVSRNSDDSKPSDSFEIATSLSDDETTVQSASEIETIANSTELSDQQWKDLEGIIDDIRGTNVELDRIEIVLDRDLTFPKPPQPLLPEED